MKLKYETPQLVELGSFELLTNGAGGSCNDGVGGGTGMASETIVNDQLAGCEVP